VTVTGLTPYTSYTCTLHAVTVSDGPNSDPVIVTTAEEGAIFFHAIGIHIFSTAPSPPLLTAVIAINSTSITVQWSIPTELNGVLASYTIVYNAENDPEKTVIVVFNGELVSNMLLIVI